jgi:thiol-disulfide isomerase/thioredoxin
MVSLIAFSALVFTRADGPTLVPGTAAPKIEVGGWVKGAAPAKGRFQVVEFWATWCGPCKTSIPHLTEMAKTYQGKVDFVGVSVSERVPDIPKAVAAFVADMGAKMEYNVAYDSTDKKMSANWMRAAGRNTIPSAFLLNPEGKVLWIGHPMQMEPKIKEALAGTLNIEAERKAYVDSMTKAAAKTADTAKLVEAMNNRPGMKESRAATALYTQGKKDEAEVAWAKLEAEKDINLSHLGLSSRISAYVTGKDEKFFSAAEKLIAGDAYSHSLLASSINRAATNKSFEAPKLKELADRLMATAKEYSPFYSLGLAYTKLGEKALAVQAYEKSLSLIETSPNKDKLGNLKTSIEKLVGALKSSN